MTPHNPEASTGGIWAKSTVQVAGIRDEDEARMLVDCKVDFFGFPLGVPIHKEDVTEADARRIIRAVGLQESAVLITYLDLASDVCDLCRSVGGRIVQLHGVIGPDEAKKIRQSDPRIGLIKAIVIDDSGSTDYRREIDAFAEYVDAFITDTLDPLTGARGATGKTHDWQRSREIVTYSKRPVVLAGGLNPKNVGEAIREVRPAGVDVHTGVEGMSGSKEQDLVEAFVSEARSGLARP